MLEDAAAQVLLDLATATIEIDTWPDERWSP